MADPLPHPRLAPLAPQPPQPSPPQPSLPPSRRGRALKGIVLRLVVLGLAGTGAWAAGTKAADEIERMSRQHVGAALKDGGFDWAQVETDGLTVRLSGSAPDEVQRFRALDRAATVVDGRRIVDRVTVAVPQPQAAPVFSVELLRNDAGVSLIGLVPAGTDRAALLASVQAAVGRQRVTDLLEDSDQPAPDGWGDALRFGTPQTTVLRRLGLRLLSYGLAFACFVLLSALDGQPWFFSAPDLDATSVTGLLDDTAWMPLMATVFGLTAVVDLLSSAPGALRSRLGRRRTAQPA